MGSGDPPGLQKRLFRLPVFVVRSLGGGEMCTKGHFGACLSLIVQLNVQWISWLGQTIFAVVARLPATVPSAS